MKNIKQDIVDGLRMLVGMVLFSTIGLWFWLMVGRLGETASHFVSYAMVFAIHLVLIKMLTS